MVVLTQNQKERAETEDKKPDFHKGYCILMEYWDSLPDEEKEDINKRLEEAGC